MKSVVACAFMLAFATAADGQVRRRVPAPVEPSVWVGVSAGLFNANDVSDGATASTWDFGRASTPQYRLALEKALSGSISIGAVGTWANLPFTYIGRSGDNGCSRCEAHLDVVSLGASFHLGGRRGFHQVLEASAGALQYRNLRRDSDDSELAPLDGNVDPYFTFGYGFGYGFGRNTQVSVVQDFGLALHEREGLSSEQSNTFRQRTIRANFRYGLGRARRRITPETQKQPLMRRTADAQNGR